MKIKYRFLATLSLVAIGQIGCDRLPEAFSGKPSPDTKAIHAVGPNQNDSHGMARVVPGTPESISETDPNFKEIDRSVRPTKRGNSNVQLISDTTISSDNDSSETLPANTETQIPAVSVPTTALSPGQVRPRADGIVVDPLATLKFVNDIEIAAPADGVITRLDLKEGDFVEKDVILMELDKRLVEAELDVAKNELKVAMEKSRDDSEIKYSKSAEEVAKQDFANSNELLKMRVESNGDNRKKWLEHRRSELAITVAELKHNQDVVAVEVSLAKERKAKVQSDMLTVKSAFSGIIASKEKDVSEWVRAGEVVFRLVSLDRMKVVGSVSIDSLDAPPHLLLGAPAKVLIQLYPGVVEEVQGRVDFVSPSMDSSRAYKVWIEIPNKLDNNQWLFRDGMISTIEINTRGPRQ